MTTVYVATALVVFILGLFAVITDRQAEIDRLREAAERAGRERDAAEVERDIASELLARYKADARVVLPIRPERVLRVVEQRTGSHDDLPPSAEVDGFAWPEIAREAFPIRQWGEEAES